MIIPAKSATPGAPMLGTVITAEQYNASVSTWTRPTVLLDGSQTAITAWAGYEGLSVGDRVLVVLVGKEAYIVSGRVNFDTGWIDSAVAGRIVTGASGVFTVTRCVARRIGDVVNVLLSGTLAAAITVAAATGNTTDTTLATLTSEFTPTSPYVQTLTGASPPLIIGYVTNTGSIMLAGTVVNATLPSGTSIIFGGTYFI